MLHAIWNVRTPSAVQQNKVGKPSGGVKNIQRNIARPGYKLVIVEHLAYKIDLSVVFNVFQKALLDLSGLGKTRHLGKTKVTTIGLPNSVLWCQKWLIQTFNVQRLLQVPTMNLFC